MKSELNDQRLSEQIRDIIENQYDLGQAQRIREIFGGFCNKSYAVWTHGHAFSGKFLLRRYNPAIAESEIRFEHALINHLQQHGFELAAAVISGRSGQTFYKTPALTPINGNAQWYWGLFEFLEGQDKYSWTETDLTDAEFTSCAQILARLHAASHDFVKPVGADRAQPRIMDFVPNFKDRFRGYARLGGNRRCDRLLTAHIDVVAAELDRCLAAATSFVGMLELPIHCDYHPGNLKYEDEQGVGLFDFDWSKVDYRLFDLALALVYFCSVWEGARAGSLRADKLALFLSSYNAQCRDDDRIAALTDQERQALPTMMAIANLYVLNWDLADFYEPVATPVDDEYFKFINHNLQLMYWIGDQGERINQAIYHTDFTGRAARPLFQPNDGIELPEADSDDAPSPETEPILPEPVVKH